MQRSLEVLVNTAPEAKPEMIRDPETTDRRHGMKLISGARRRSGFRIELSDGLRQILREDFHHPEKKAAADHETDDRINLAVVFASAVVSGVLVGYLLGRR